MSTRQHRLREALRISASALKEDGPDFALAGSYALWVYGGPEPTHDVDLVVAESEAEAAAQTLAKAGFDIERPVEDWLLKARLGDAVVDVLHRLNGVAVNAAALAVVGERPVLALRIKVLTPTMVLTQKLRALDEHYCDFTLLLPAARAVRERVDWAALRADTADNDYAAAFLVLADRLGLTDR